MRKDMVPHGKSSRVVGRRTEKYDIGSDAKAIWADVVFDVLQSDRENARLARAVDTISRYDTRAFLAALDAVQDVLNEEYFHSSTFGVVDDDAGTLSIKDEGFGVELPARLESRGIPQALVTLVEITWELSEENPITFLGKIYQIVAFPLRIDIGACEFDYEAILQVNNSRDSYRPSRLLKRIARRIFNDDFVKIVEENFAPKHGPGSVAFAHKGRIKTKRLEVWEKDDVLSLSKLRTLIEASGLPEPLFLRELVSLTSDTSFCPSQLMDVPKTWKKRRLIAIEDATRMFFAKGVQAGLYAAIKQHRLLKTVINLEDASKNCEAARWGSLTGQYATVDLSAASDSIGVVFVQELFGEDSRLWRILRYARPNEIAVPGRGVVKNNIFATMGNAVCFPILTLVVTLILFEAHLICKVRRSSPRVYGDDAVCEEQVTETFIRLLEGYGFTVNRRKTFAHESVYRESCGGEYLRGHDITPLRLSRKFPGLRLGRGFEHYIPLVTLANELYARGFLRAYRRVTKVLAGFGYTPFTEDGLIGLRHALPDVCMSRYPRLRIAGYGELWIVADILKARAPHRKMRGLAGYIEWMYRFGNRDEGRRVSAESLIDDDTGLIIGLYVSPYDLDGPREARKSAAGVRPANYHRARVGFNSKYAYLADWEVKEGVCHLTFIDPAFVACDEDAKWREL